MIENLPKAKRIYYKKFNRIKDYELIKQLYEEEKWDISFMCKELGIARASYYKWLHRKPYQKELENEEIVSKMKEISKSNNSLFGTMKMCFTLKTRYGFSCGHNRVYRLMCINNIKSIYRNKKRNPPHIKSIPEETSENILNRDFNADKPNEKWCTDVAEIKIPGTNDKLFISPVLDLYDNYPIVLEISERNDAVLANKALENAHNLYPEAKPLYHSDRGFAYTRTVFKKMLEEYGMTQSMSRVSKCIDNGPCESFQGRFKDLLFILYPNIKTKNEMIDAINGTLNYYINHYPQKRFGGKTCGQVRKEAFESNLPIKYPIKKANKYIKFWKKIKNKQENQKNNIIESYKQSLNDSS